MDSLAKSSASTLLNFISEKKISSVNLSIAQHDASWLFLNAFSLLQNSKNISVYSVLSNKKEECPNDLNIAIINIETRYFNIEENRDSLQRESFLHLESFLKSKNTGKIESLPPIKLVYKDKIPRENADRLNNKSYQFANASIPEEQKTFWEEVGVPFILVSSAIITVVLLFTVRSK
ncbi:MAG: hypothetical protein WCT77_01220 [Bacteroidota bacterium]